ncbi:hypothetical protein BDR06DRAFT_980138 [Suillus hirtellus]|nr:hypothetical protein BDR06DRAFT_980138 [Suillus hirtellus]
MCLNLPLDIQYKPENMYLAGIIPGPLEPSGDQLNYFLDPVVNNLVESWECGIRFSCTALQVHGRVTRSTIACLVCDLPAARKATQLAGPTSHFYCTACHCLHRSTCGRTDVHSADWGLQDKNEMRRFAELWKNAGTSAECNKLFASHRVQWSMLWRPPYWDPSCQLVVDTMHCLLEGLAHNHFHKFLGLTADSVQQKTDALPAFHHPFPNVDLNKPESFCEKDIKTIKSIHNLLTAAVPDLEGNDTQLIKTHMAKLERRLSSKMVACLQFMSVELGIGPNIAHPGKKIYKAHWVRSLIDWRQTKPFTTKLSKLHITTSEVMQHIVDVIRTTDTSSSLRSVPYNFGEAKTGTLKADEWHTLTTVYLPIVLVSLWGKGSQHHTSEVAANHRTILDHTMSLVSAVHIACLQFMTTAQAQAYRKYIVVWIQDLQILHPHAPHCTNGHMVLHVWDYLQLFRPMWSWWCFPYECLIGQLQHLPINHILQESTLLSSYIKAAKLKYWLNRPSCPPVFMDVKSLFDRFVSPTDATLEDSPIPPANENQAVLHARIIYKGSVYACESTHVGNSLILYYPDGVMHMQIPGIIKYIFRTKHGVGFTVRHHLLLHSYPDPFCHYPHFPAQLHSSVLADHLEVVMPEWVVLHFAQWNFSSQHIIAVSLCRVHIPLTRVTIV